MAKPTYATLCRCLARFERAADAYAFRGTLPRFESEAAAEAYEACEYEYEAAKAALRNGFRQLTNG
jgi:hypothetical protein